MDSDSSGGDAGGHSSDDAGTISRHSRSGRRKPVDLPEDDDSDDDRRRRRRRYEDEDEYDDEDDIKPAKSRKHQVSKTRDYDSEDDDQWESKKSRKKHSNSHGSDKKRSGKKRSHHQSDDEYDDEDEQEVEERPKKIKREKWDEDDDDDEEEEENDDRHDRRRREREQERERRRRDDDEEDEEEEEEEEDDRDTHRKRHSRRERHAVKEEEEDEIQPQPRHSSRHQRSMSDEEEEDDDERVDGDEHNNDDIGRENNVNDVDNDEEEKMKARYVSTFDKAVEKTKANRRRKNEPSQEVVEQECISFLERMQKARENDLDSFRRGEPALEKIKMLRDVERMMTKVHHREYLLDNMLLAAFRSWLDRLPDGSLPNIQVRTTLLNLLHDLRIDEDWVDRLESSQGLGKVIHFLSKKDDHDSNKRLAEKIMMKWARPVYRMNSDFTELLDEFHNDRHRAGKESVAAERGAAMRTVQRLKTTEQKLRESRQGQEDTRVMATAPRPAPFLFTTVVKGSTQKSEKLAKEIRSSAAKAKKMNRTISNLRRITKGSGSRGSRPSINGR